MILYDRKNARDKRRKCTHSHKHNKHHSYLSVACECLQNLYRIFVDDTSMCVISLSAHNSIFSLSFTRTTQIAARCCCFNTSTLVVIFVRLLFTCAKEKRAAQSGQSTVYGMPHRAPETVSDLIRILYIRFRIFLQRCVPTTKQQQQHNHCTSTTHKTIARMHIILLLYYYTYAYTTNKYVHILCISMSRERGFVSLCARALEKCC